MKRKRTESRNKLVTDNMGLVYKAVSRLRGRVKFAFNDVDEDDLNQEGFIALMRAADTYDPAASKFSTHATNVIIRHLIDHIRKYEHLRESSTPEIENIPFPSLIAGKEPDLMSATSASGFCSQQSEDNIRAACEGLRQSCTEAVVMHYVYGMKVKEIADIFDITQQQASRIIAEAIERLREKDNLSL